jgi:hypothetical protein
MTFSKKITDILCLLCLLDQMRWEENRTTLKKKINSIFVKANTCYTGGVVFLEQGDTLHVQNMEQNRSSLKGQTGQITVDQPESGTNGKAKTRT